MTRISAFFTQVPLDRRGVALPLALVGLLAVSLLVTTAMVTSTTEASISAAHQDATRALYRAEGGLQAFVAANGVNLVPGAPAVLYTPPGGTADDQVVITPVHVMDRPLAAGATLRVFMISSRSQAAGSRQVVATLRQVIPASLPLNTNVQSAITLSGNLNVNGNAFTVSGRTTDQCATNGGVQAVVRSDSSVITVNHQNHMDNFLGTQNGANTQGHAAITNSGMDKRALVRHTLGLSEGQDIWTLIDRIPGRKKWGPMFPLNGTVRPFSGVVGPADTVAVVDGNGGFVDLLGGSGMLIIVNGHLRMRGNSSFQGMIIVEGNFDLAGTPTVSGALISLDDIPDIDPLTGQRRTNIINLDDSAVGSGHITVQYNRCNVLAAEQAFGALAQNNQVPSIQPTLSWMEVVR